MKHKVSELDGALLDAAVAKACGLPWRIVWDRCIVEATVPKYSEPPATFGQPGGQMIVEKSFTPSSAWSQGGPIIDREQITLVSPDRLGPPHTDWRAETMAVLTPPPYASGQSGPAPLIAAMRAYVVSRFGAEVEL